MKYLMEFTVKGTADFPYDLLAQDESFPRTAEDAAKLPALHPRKVALCAYVDHDFAKPSLEFWNAKGWPVITCEVSDIPQAS